MQLGLWNIFSLSCVDKMMNHKNDSSTFIIFIIQYKVDSLRYKIKCITFNKAVNVTRYWKNNVFPKIVMSVLLFIGEFRQN